MCLLYYLMRKNVVCLLYEGEAEKVVLGGWYINKKKIYLLVVGEREKCYLNKIEK